MNNPSLYEILTLSVKLLLSVRDRVHVNSLVSVLLSLHQCVGWTEEITQTSA